MGRRRAGNSRLGVASPAFETALIAQNSNFVGRKPRGYTAERCEARQNAAEPSSARNARIVQNAAEFCVHQGIAAEPIRATQAQAITVAVVPRIGQPGLREASALAGWVGGYTRSAWICVWVRILIDPGVNLVHY